MAENLQARAEALFAGFMAPLVLGGALRPGRIFGARAALTIGIERVVSDSDLSAHVDLGRIRVARKLAPIDRVSPASPAEWTLAACLHDIVQSTHPGLGGWGRGDSSLRVLALVRAALERVPAPATAAEAISRHGWFSRVFEIARADTKVSWWIGSDTYRGVEPPTRLLSWPDVRRVHVEKTMTNVTKLADVRILVPFHETLALWLQKNPLTDLATADRELVPFQWSEPSLALVASDVGRTLAARAIRFTAAAGALPTIDRATTALASTNAKAGEIARAFVAEASFFDRADSPHADGA